MIPFPLFALLALITTVTHIVLETRRQDGQVLLITTVTHIVVFAGLLVLANQYGATGVVLLAFVGPYLAQAVAKLLISRSMRPEWQKTRAVEQRVGRQVEQLRSTTRSSER